MQVIPVTIARKDIYNLMAQVNEKGKPVELTNRRDKENSVVIIPRGLWDQIAEKLAMACVDTDVPASK